MKKIVLTAAVMGFFLLLVAACESLNQPPTVIYPDPIKDSSVYRVDKNAIP